MNLLLLTLTYPTPWEPTNGPFNLALVTALTAAGHSVRVVAPVPWTVALRRGRSGVTRYQPGVENGIATYPTYFYTPKVLRQWYGSFLWLSIRATVNRLFRGFRPDAILAYWAHPDGEAALRAARRCRVPAVVMVGGSDALILTRDPARRRRVVSVLTAADAVLSVGEDLKIRLVKLGVPPERVHVFHRGVDESVFSPGDQAAARKRVGLDSNDRVLLWVGRMVAVKGVDVLLDACRRLEATGTEFRLVLVGDGPQRRCLEAKALRLGLDGRVVFVGQVSHPQMGDWYRAADLTVLSSHSEGVPNVLLESMACGTPFVGTRVGGIPGLASDPHDIVPPADPIALAAAIAHRLATAPPSCRTNVRFSWAQAANTVTEVLDDVVEARHRQALPRLGETHDAR